MSPKRKSGLQRGLADIVEKQTAPVEDKSQLSRGLIGKFADNRSEAITPATLRTQSTEGSQPIAPARDFQKVANSITREAIPAGMFNGKAKQLYDCLYSMTRGAIVPSMTVRISRAGLMKKSGIGAKVTLEQNLRRLIASGLVSMKTIGGIQGGNEYTVMLPEEATLPSTPPSPPSGGENVGLLAPLESRTPSPGLSVDDATGSGEPKTSFKTSEKTFDDEATRRFVETLKQAERELTGKASTSAEKWNELAQLLVTELKIAATRTTVSNVPAFLTEHLRRRLWKIDQQRASEIAAASSPTTEQGSSAPALSDEQRRRCPDCAGTNFYYPDGPEKGVAKCKHARLGEGK